MHCCFRSEVVLTGHDLTVVSPSSLALLEIACNLCE